MPESCVPLRYLYVAAIYPVFLDEVLDEVLDLFFIHLLTSRGRWS